MSRGMSRFRVICRCLSWCALLAAYASSSCRNSMRAFTQSRCTGSAAGRSRSGYGRSHSSTNRARCACSAASPQLSSASSAALWSGAASSTASMSGSGRGHSSRGPLTRSGTVATASQDFSRSNGRYPVRTIYHPAQLVAAQVRGPNEHSRRRTTAFIFCACRSNRASRRAHDDVQGKDRDRRLALSG